LDAAVRLGSARSYIAFCLSRDCPDQFIKLLRLGSILFSSCFWSFDFPPVNNPAIPPIPAPIAVPIPGAIIVPTLAPIAAPPKPPDKLGIGLHSWE
jgi:hypothetical protein